MTRYQVLATDYDGTLAHDGKVDEPTLEALKRARHYGLELVMVTGRELSDLANTFQHVKLFGRVVAENGGVLLRPSDESLRILGEPPPVDLVTRLRERNVPLSVGHSIIATLNPYLHDVERAITDLGLEWHVVLNKGSVMALPAHVSKGSGLAAALEELSVPAEATVGIGDAENDADFLARCGWSVAVANALPSVKAIADHVTVGARGEGVVELVRALTP